MGLWSGITSVAKKAANAATGGITGTAENLYDGAKDIVNGNITDGVWHLGNAATGGQLDNVVNTAQGVYGAGKKLVNGDVGGAIYGLADTASGGVLGGVTDAAVGLGKGIASGAGAAWNGIKDAAGSVGNAVAAPNLQDYLNRFGGGAGDVTSSAFDPATSQMQQRLAQSYQGSIDGTAPSVAQNAYLAALARSNAGIMGNVAPLASGANVGMAIRSAANATGQAGMGAASQLGQLRAQEIDQARAGQANILGSMAQNSLAKAQLAQQAQRDRNEMAYRQAAIEMANKGMWAGLAGDTLGAVVKGLI